MRILVLTDQEFRDLNKVLTMAASSRSQPTAALGEEVLAFVTDSAVPATIAEVPATIREATDA